MTASLHPGKVFSEHNALLYMDISPMEEAAWTGIPVVAAGLAGSLLARLPGRVRFFFGTDLISPQAVADSLRRRSGAFLAREIASGRARAGSLPAFLPPSAQTQGVSVGLFASVKPLRRAFDLEASVCHDLSTLLLPQFHTAANVAHHMEALMADIASNDVCFAVSSATRDDMVAYLGVDPARVTVVPNGVSWPADFAPRASNELACGVEPYVLILGTREPRKNVTLVFDMLERAPALLAAHRFVFTGKSGWLEEQHGLPKSLEAARAAGRILFTGYVDDFTKYTLLAGAQVSLYPSLFEGFGLPVLESLSVGTPAVASWSSSIPEAGGDVCSYFDPLSAADLQRALRAALARRAAEGEALAAACRAHAEKFTWTAATSRILERLVPLIAAR